MACPSAVVRGGWWPDGLSHQEAPQADGEEEAPQAAEEDANPAQEQEVGFAVTGGGEDPAISPPLPPRGPGAPGTPVRWLPGPARRCSGWSGWPLALGPWPWAARDLFTFALVAAVNSTREPPLGCRRAGCRAVAAGRSVLPAQHAPLCPGAALTAPRAPALVLSTGRPSRTNSPTMVRTARPTPRAEQT